MSDILDNVTVKLTREGVEQILSKYFFKEGYDVEKFTFEIVTDEDRHGNKFSPELKTVSCV